MKQNQFNTVVAECYRVEEKTLTVFFRALKEAKLLTSGARGVNAPHMLPIDAARVTMALLSTDMPSKAVERVNRFASIPFSSEKSADILPDFLKDVSPLTVENALTAMFADGPNDRLEVFYVEFQENARTVRIEHKKGVFWFRDQARTDDQKNTDRRELFGIRRSRGLAGAELLPLQILINQEIPAEMERVSPAFLAVGALLQPYAVKDDRPGDDDG